MTDASFVFVWKLYNKFLSRITFLFTKLLKFVSSLVRTMLCYCLYNCDMSTMTSITGRQKVIYIENFMLNFVITKHLDSPHCCF